MHDLPRLNVPVSSVRSVEVRHAMRRELRWSAFLTLPFKLVLWTVIGIAIVVLYVWLFFDDLFDTGGDGDADGEHDSSPSRDNPYDGRIRRKPPSELPGWLRIDFFRRAHRITLSANDGAHQVEILPSSEAEADELLAGLADAAKSGGFDLTEVLEAEPSAALARWSPEAPFGADPELTAPVEDPTPFLEEKRFTFEASEDGCTIHRTDEPTIFSKWLLLMFLLFALGLSPFLVWFRSFREGVGQLLLDLAGLPPIRESLTVTRDGAFHYRRTRGPRTLEKIDLEPGQILGVVYSEELRYDDQVSFAPPRLRVIGAARTVRVDLLHDHHPEGRLLAESLRYALARLQPEGRPA